MQYYTMLASIHHAILYCTSSVIHVLMYDNIIMSLIEIIELIKGDYDSKKYNYTFICTNCGDIN